MSVGDPEIDGIITKLIPALQIVTDGKIPKGFAALRFDAIDVQTVIEEVDLTDGESEEELCECCGKRALVLIIGKRRFSHVTCMSMECRQRAMKSIHVQSENHETEKYQRLLERAIKWQTK